jgi:TRAP-type mannitol/chloroaromatic compound transport system permease large subunit
LLHPAEAAAAGAFGAILLSWFYKTLKWQNFKESVFLTCQNYRNDYVVIYRILDILICVSLI